LEDLILDLPRDPHTADRDGLPVENDEVDHTRIELLEHDGFGRTLHEFKRRKIGMGPCSEGQNDLFTDVSIIAVHQDTQGLVFVHTRIVHNGLVATTTVIPASRLHGQEGRPSMVAVGTIVWLSSELMFFAALFAAYFTIRNISPELWATETEKLNIGFATVNTTILVLSSVACQFGVFAAEKGRVGRLGSIVNVGGWGLREWFVLTYIMGAIFIGGQVLEYAEIVHQDVTIAASAYGSVFYLATGIHGLHVIGGLIAFLLVIGRTFMARTFTHEQAISAIAVSYYWHFVDIVWIGLFATVYLIR